MKVTLVLTLVGLAVIIGDVGRNHCSGEKILVVAFISSKSHKLTYMPLIEELGKRGHSVTVLSPVKATKTLKNVNEILALDGEALFEKLQKEQKMDPFKMKEQEKIASPFMMFDHFAQVCRDTYDLPHVQDLLKEHFDLVFMQPMINECALGLVYRIGAPLILFSPTSVLNFLSIRTGSYLPPSIVPNVFLDFSSEMTFLQRMINFGTDLFIMGTMKFMYESKVENLYREIMGHDIPSISEILGNASLILSNGHFSLHGHKPFLPDIVDVGGLHSRAAQPLPKDLEDFIQKGKQTGFIYFSMGSAIKGSTMSDEKRKIFLNVFSKLKQQVLWKWETESMADLPENVKLSKWLPQQDLLGHKDIKMFITHCGGGSVEESIYHGVPLVGLPMIGDQPLNAKMAQKHGFVVELDWNKLTESDLQNAINDLLNDPTYCILEGIAYVNNAKKISSLFKDQPDEPLNRAVYWVEYVLRHKGAPHLRSKAARSLNFLQYHSFDVIGAYLAIATALICLLYKIIKLFFKFCCSLLYRGKVKEVAASKKKN